MNNKSFQQLKGGIVENDKYLLRRINQLTQDVNTLNALNLGSLSLGNIISLPDDSTVVGDGVADDSAAINAIIAANPNKIIYFGDQTYHASLNVSTNCILLGGNGARIVDSTASSVITLNSDCTIHSLEFENIDAAGQGLENKDRNCEVFHCTFIAFTNDTGAAGDSLFTDCRFTTITALVSDIGTKCWSAGNIFRNCIFNGYLGADVQDATFYDCIFGDDDGDSFWGVHMPEGGTNNSGNPSGFNGDAKFYNCTMYAGDNATTKSYAIGLGNDAHPVLRNCTIIGNLYGAYARSKSTFDMENCYMRAKETSGGAASLGFAKYNPGGWPPNTDGEGDSTVKGGKLVSGEYSLLVPDTNTLGSVTLDGVDLEWDKLIVTDNGGFPVEHNLGFLYITSVIAIPDSLFQDIDVTVSGQVIAPPYTPSGAMFIQPTNLAAGSKDIRLTKFYRNPDGFYKNGSLLIIRGVSDTNLIKIKNGYYAPETTLVTCAGNADIELGSGDVAVFIYYTNAWHEVTNFSLSQAMTFNGAQIVNHLPMVFTASATIPSPATYVLYLDDGTNHGLGGTPTLMFHNGAGWNALF